MTQSFHDFLVAGGRSFQSAPPLRRGGPLLCFALSCFSLLFRRKVLHTFIGVRKTPMSSGFGDLTPRFVPTLVRPPAQFKLPRNHFTLVSLVKSICAFWRAIGAWHSMRTA